jgi:predicted Rossmann fold nucleotide-binding protein DprA/Smf involved in DNA uptake
MHNAALTLQTIAPDHLAYPAVLKNCVAFRTAPILNAICNLELLAQNAITLFCSKQCPGDLILKTCDLAQSLRDGKISVISGFHTQIEQDCLKILLRGTQPIIHCPARSIHKIRLSSEQKRAVDENRLLIISPFSASYPRVTAELAGKRNEMIGAISHTVFIAYAAPNSRTLAFAQRLIVAGKSVVTFASSSNPLLQEQGIVGLDIDEIVQRCLDAQIPPTQKAASIDNER